MCLSNPLWNGPLIARLATSTMWRTSTWSICRNPLWIYANVNFCIRSICCHHPERVWPKRSTGHSGGWMRKSRKSKRKDLRQTRQSFKRRNSLSGMPLPLLVRKQSRMKIFKTSCRMNMTFSSKHNVDVTAICRRNGTSLYRSVPWGTVAKENVWKDSSFRTQREIYGTRKTPYWSLRPEPDCGSLWTCRRMLRHRKIWPMR